MKKPKVKSNTKTQQEIRKKKKDNGIVTVTLELEENEYEALQKLSIFLAQGNIEPGQKKVIKIYSKLFNYLLANFNEQLPEDNKSKSFYRRCAIAQFYKRTSKLNDNEIIETLNNLKGISNKGKLFTVTTPQYNLANSIGNKIIPIKRWDLKSYQEALDDKFVTNGIKNIRSQLAPKRK